MGWNRKHDFQRPTDKRCPMCEKVKTLDKFYTQYDEIGPTRISTYCRKCELKYQRMNYIPVGER